MRYHDVRVGLDVADGVGRGLYGGSLEWCLKAIALAIVQVFLNDLGLLTGEVDVVLSIQLLYNVSRLFKGSFVPAPIGIVVGVLIRRIHQEQDSL